jgi:hypothetical protein
LVFTSHNRYPAKIKNLPLGEETGDRRQEIGDRRRKINEGRRQEAEGEKFL